MPWKWYCFLLSHRVLIIRFWNLIIKTGTLSAINNTEIKFKTPFLNFCLGVFLTDLSSADGLKKQSVVADSITKNGFVFATESLYSDGFIYLAIGY